MAPMALIVPHSDLLRAAVAVERHVDLLISVLTGRPQTAVGAGAALLSVLAQTLAAVGAELAGAAVPLTLLA